MHVPRERRVTSSRSGLIASRPRLEARVRGRGVWLSRSEVPTWRL